MGNSAKRTTTASFSINYESKKPQLIAGDGTVSLKGKRVTVTMGPVSYAIVRLNER